MKPLKFKSLIIATVFLSLASHVAVAGNTIKISSALAQTPTAQNRKAEADSFLEQGIKQLDNQQPSAALQSFQQALAIYREIKDTQGEGNTLKRLGDACLSLKEYTKAIAFYQQSLVIIKAISARELEGRVLNNLGLANKELGDSTKAIEYYQQALAIAKEINNRKLEQIALNNLGFIHVALGNSTKVVEYYQQVLAIARELKDYPAQASALAYLGYAYASLNNNQKAIDFAQQALTLSRETKNTWAEALALDTFSRTYSFLGDAQKTIEFGQQALAVARQIKNNLLEGRALAFLGNAYASLDENQKAIEFAQQALGVARQNKNSGAEAIALDTLTRSYSSREEPQKVLEFGQASLAVARQIKNNLFEWRALVFLCEAHYFLGNSQQAVEFAQQSLTLARESQNRTFESGALSVLSGVHAALRDYQKAIELAQQSLVIAREIKNRKLESTALSALGGAYWALRHYQKGIEYRQQALAIYRELKDRDSELSALHGINANYIFLGDYQKVIELAQQELALAREIKNHDYEGIALAYLGFAYFAQGDSQKIIEYGQQALAVGRESKSNIAEFFGLLALSIGHGNLGNNEKALEFSQASLAIARDPKLGRRLVDAEQLSLDTLGSIYRKVGQKEQAIAAYRESLAIDNGGFTAQVGLARAYRELNMPITAIAYYKQAIGSVEQIRGKILGLPRQLQESFLKALLIDTDKARNTDSYRELADLLLSQKRILEAQQVLELLKVQELRDFTKDARAGGEKLEVALHPTEEQIKKEKATLIAFGQKIYECQQTKCSQLSQLLDQRQTLTEQYNQKIQTIEKDIRERRAKDDAFFDPNKLNKAKEIVESQPGTVLIYPLVLPDKIWVLWTSQGGIIKSVEVPNIGQKQLGETVLKFRQLLQNPNSDITQVKATGKQLYDWLIKPIEPEVKANKIQNLVFSLDRATRYIPMSALFDGEKYLVENYAVSLVLSADLTDTKDRLPSGTQNTPVLALGLSNAVAGYNALPNVPAELDAIVRKKPSDTTGIYPGLEFLNETFDFRALRDNLTGRKILHVATHGQFVPGRQEDSYLLLGKGDKLTITQIKTLQDLSNVHLVVLSACETALGGPDQDGVEISGISFYFLNAGAKAVMASLWLVNDESTSQLMQHFYRNLAQGTATTPITKATALRQAQLSLLRGQPAKTDTADQRSLLVVKPGEGSQTASTNTTTPGFSHPYYWAPFILIGNGL